LKPLEKAAICHFEKCRIERSLVFTETKDFPMLSKGHETS